jgi:glycosyltransferase involved in cell wall biosynthesis
MEVVRGYHLLKQQRRITEKLVLVGHNISPYGKKVRTEILRLGLQDDVVLAGNISYQDLPSVYRHAKVNIFASACENCPNILLEALGAGRPLLVSDHPPMPEFGGDAVAYFVPSSPQDFADKLASLINNPNCMANLSRRAHERSRVYDWRETARLTWEAIEHVHRIKEDKSR